MLVVQPIRNRDMHLIPAIAAGLVASGQQDRIAQRIECVEDPVRTSFAPNPQLPHMRMARQDHP